MTHERTLRMDSADVQPSRGLRSAIVTLGPSVLLIGAFKAATVAAIAGFVRRPRNRRGGLIWLAATCLAGVPWAYLAAVRPWVLHWGATHDEVRDELPGDEIVRRPSWRSTRAIDIAAPVEQVWPWLAQMGQDRGGLYSYDWLENLAGLEFHSADRIVPEWQTVRVGDIVRFAPRQDTIVVTRVVPNHCLVWRVLNPSTHQPLDASWAFVISPIDATHTRLIQRFRFGAGPRLLGSIFYTALIEIPHFVMERKMLLGIRSRAERTHADSTFPNSR
ncbi:MAG: SRPBCC family protein [Mycobacterium sp.]|nr:SRPBCC family protein [Mycobacterium sp.]